MDTTILILFLIFLEGILSFDNALVLAAIVHPLPREQQRKALTYGIIGAYAFRFLSLFFITSALENPYFRLAGGLYLVWLAVRNLLFNEAGTAQKSFTLKSFWRVIVAVELADCAFSLDSIFAAAGVTQVLWIVLAGGCFGILMMRFAANIFITLIDHFPRFTQAAFIMVLIVGVKLIVEAIGPWTGWETSFHQGAPAMHAYWMLMSLAIGWGFSRKAPLYHEKMKSGLDTF